MKYSCLVSYDGSDFLGYERQKEGRTIQGELERFLTYYLGVETTIKASGRTDAGVHALGQCICFDSPRPLDPDQFVYASLKLLPNDIAVRELVERSDDFDARLSAISKAYVYRFYKGERDPFRERYALKVEDDFNFPRFMEAMNLYLGKHSFLNFTSKEMDVGGYFRDITMVEGRAVGKGIFEVEVRAHGFMRYMVRMMVGTAMAYARGKIDSFFIKEKLEGRAKAITPYVAPAKGLTLKEVTYASNI